MVQKPAMAQDPVAQAIQYMNADRPRAARKLLRGLLSSRPDHPDANHILGIIELRAGKLEAAKKRITRALRANPDMIYAHNNLGEVYRAQNRLDKAAECYRRVLDVDAAMPEAHNNLGLVLEQLGETDEAISCYRSALSITPDDTEILQNLATALQRQGEMEEAETCLRAIIEHNPKLADIHNNLGVVLQKLNRLDEAVDCFRKAIALSPAHIGAHNNLGQALKTMARFDEAIEAYEQALSLVPDDVQTHYNLANTFWEAGDLEQALAMYEKTLAIAPGDPKCHRIVAGAYVEAGRWDDAIERYQKALAIKPDYYEAHNDLGVLYERMHELEKAEGCVQKALHIATDDPETNLTLAVLHRRRGEMDKAIETLEPLTGKSMPQRTHARIHFELGRLYDRQKDTDKAFHNFSIANDLQAQSELSTVFKKDVFLSEVTLTEQALTAEWINSWQSVSEDPDTATPAFIVGFTRSGTTLLDQILDSHPKMQVMEEKEVIHHDLIDEVAEAHGDHNAALPTLSEGEIKDLRDLYFRSIERYVERDPATLFVDKFPLNIRHLPLIVRVFPKAKIILALRHPCDVVLSNFMQDFKMNNAMANFLTLEDTAHCYAEVMGLWQKCVELLPMDFHVVRYEALVANFEQEVRQLLEFLEVGWDDAVLDHVAHAKNRSAITTPSYQAVTEPIYNRARYRWKRYSEQFKPVMGELSPFIEAFGYAETDGQ